MPVIERRAADLVAAATGLRPSWLVPGSPEVVLVDLDELAAVDERHHGALPSSVGMVVVGRSNGDRAVTSPLVDVVVGADDAALEAIVATVERAPLAAAALVLALRGSESRSLDDGLLIESATYSTLQAGPEFATWLAARPVRHRPRLGDPVSVERGGDALHITLQRPEVRNALNAEMRDQLVDALTLALVDDSIREVTIGGAGPSFCAGGDLDEFGSFPSVAAAHLIRLDHSIGRTIAALGSRLTVHLHGACAGSGIELAAFAANVTAAPDTVCSLPELSMGLIPGAGGTVSLPRRIGRQATARLALAGERWALDAALSSGLVDRAKLSG